MAEIGRTFGRVAAAYERTRPEYPDDAVDWLTESLALGPASCVVDLGAGTGKLTRKLRARVGDVVAVEPDEGMRAANEGALAGRAEDVPLGDASADAVFAGDAFHWFDPSLALPEIHRVLRPGGGIAILFNVWWGGEDPPLPPTFLDELKAGFRRLEPRRRVAGNWRTNLVDSGFAEPQERTFSTTSQLSGRDVVDLMLTASSFAFLDDGERAAIAERAYPIVEPTYRLTTKTFAAWTRPA